MKTIKVVQQKFDYAILQTELNQLKQKRKRVELLKKIKKRKRLKSLNFLKLNSFVNEWIMIDEFQKKKFFKIINLKKYKNTT
jgi:predicted ribonuclease YlaK